MQLERIALLPLPPSRLSPAEQLRVAGHRVTPQRVLLLRLLEEANEHLDAESLYQRASAEDASISLATVYRTLAVFKKLGLVEQRYFARAHSKEYYEPTRRSEHHHFTCTNCGRVIEFSTPLIAEVSRAVSERHGLRVTHACVCFEGLCDACQG